MKKPINPIATTNQCIGGQKLPQDWQSKAKIRAKMAETHYQWELENAWRGNPNSADTNSMRAARLSQPNNAVQWKEILGEQ